MLLCLLRCPPPFQGVCAGAARCQRRPRVGAAAARPWRGAAGLPAGGPRLPAHPGGGAKRLHGAAHRPQQVGAAWAEPLQLLCAASCSCLPASQPALSAWMAAAAPLLGRPRRPGLPHPAAPCTARPPQVRRHRRQRGRHGDAGAGAAPLAAAHGVCTPAGRWAVAPPRACLDPPSPLPARSRCCGGGAGHPGPLTCRCLPPVLCAEASQHQQDVDEGHSEPFVLFPEVAALK